MALLLPRVSEQQKWPSRHHRRHTNQRNKRNKRPSPASNALNASDTSAMPSRPPAASLTPVSLLLSTRERLLCVVITFHQRDHCNRRKHTRRTPISLASTVTIDTLRHPTCSLQSILWATNHQIREYVSLFCAILLLLHLQV